METKHAVGPLRATSGGRRLYTSLQPVLGRRCTSDKICRDVLVECEDEVGYPLKCDATFESERQTLILRNREFIRRWDYLRYKSALPNAQMQKMYLKAG